MRRSESGFWAHRDVNAEDPHLQYLRVDGLRPMVGDLNMDGYDILNVGLINGTVDIESHASRHQYGGADPLDGYEITLNYNPINYSVSSDIIGEHIAAIDAVLSGGVTSVFGRVGNVISVSGDYNSDQITNTSSIFGSTVSDALEALNASIVGGGSGTVIGPSITTDNAIVRWSGTDGYTIQNSLVTIDDLGNISLTGTVDGRDVSVDGSTLDAHIANVSIHFTAESLGLDGYALVSDIPNINLDGYALEADLLAHTTDSTIHFTAESLDLDGYALVSDIPNINLDGYALEADLLAHTTDATIHFTAESLGLDGYALTSDIPSINLDGYALEADLLAHTTDATIHFTAESLNLDGYALTSDIPNINLDGYALEADLLAHTTDATIHFTAESLGLDGYALVSDIPNINLDGYALEADLLAHTTDSTIHFTAESLNLDGYALTSDIPNINLDGYALEADLLAHTTDSTIHFTAESLDLDGYALVSDIPNINLDGYALEADLLAHTTDVTIHFTAESLDLDGYALTSDIVKYTVGPVGSGAKFNTVQSAVTQAEADIANGLIPLNGSYGYPVTIDILNGNYTENIVCNISYISFNSTNQTYSAAINGNITFNCIDGYNNLLNINNISVLNVYVNSTAATSINISIDNCKVQIIDLSGINAAISPSTYLFVEKSRILNAGGNIIVTNGTTGSVNLTSCLLTGSTTGSCFSASSCILNKCRVTGRIQTTTFIRAYYTTFTVSNQECILTTGTSAETLYECSFIRSGTTGPVVIKNGSSALTRFGNTFSGTVSNPPITIGGGTEIIGNVLETKIGPYTFPSDPTSIFTMPSSDGVSGNVLLTNGSGVLSLQDGYNSSLNYVPTNYDVPSSNILGQHLYEIDKAIGDSGLKYTVGPVVSGAKFQTIQDAIDQAEIDWAAFGLHAQIFILNGTYTENIVVNRGSISFVGGGKSQSTYIFGNITFNLSSSSSNFFSINNIIIGGNILTTGNSDSFLLEISSSYVVSINCSSSTIDYCSLNIFESFINSYNENISDVINVPSMAELFIYNSIVSTVPTNRLMQVNCPKFYMSGSTLFGRVETSSSSNIRIDCCRFESTNQECITLNSNIDSDIITNCTFIRSGTTGSVIVKNGSNVLNRTGNSFTGSVSNPPVTMNAGTSTLGNVLETKVGPYTFPTNPTNIFTMPSSDGVSGNVLTTDGYGVLSLQDGYDISLVYTPTNYNTPSSDVLGQHLYEIDEAIGATRLSYTVGPIGSGARFQTVQEAADQAYADGSDTGVAVDIIILNGTYIENVTFRGSNICVRGSSLSYSTYIEGSITVVLTTGSDPFIVIKNMFLGGSIVFTGTTNSLLCEITTLVARNIDATALSVTDPSSYAFQINSSEITDSTANLINAPNSTVHITGSLIGLSPTLKVANVLKYDILNSYIIGRIEVPVGGFLKSNYSKFTTTNQECITINTTSGTDDILSCSFVRNGTTGPVIVKNGASVLNRAGNSFSGTVSNPPITMNAGTSTLGNVLETKVGPYTFPQSPINVFTMPSSDGVSGNVLTTDGYGVLSLQDGYDISLVYTPTNYDVPSSDVLGQHLYEIDRAIGNVTPKKSATVEFVLTEEVNNTVAYFFTWAGSTTGGLRSSATSGLQNSNNCSPYQVPFNATIKKAILRVYGVGVQNGSVTYPVSYETNLLRVNGSSETKLSDVDFSISNSYTVGTYSVGATDFTGSTTLSVNVDEGQMLGMQFQNGSSASVAGQTRMAFITLVLEER